jgi:2-polyprenyl-3-methyl-5-hydroxy-6-metoxy-1,4-benzoquinol methylase
MQSRVLQPERMDDPALDPSIHRRALAGLSRLNRVSRSASILWSSIAGLVTASPEPLRLLDIATGAGDLPVALARRARSAGATLHIAACDTSRVALETARKSALVAGADIDFFQLDVIGRPLPQGYDIITCSLFLHHLTSDQAVNLLRSMGAAAGRRVVVNDLLRSRFNLLAVTIASKLLTACPVVHTDGPLSVRAAFTIAEARALATSAGLVGAKVDPRFPSRFLLTWDKA